MMPAFIGADNPSACPDTPKAKTPDPASVLAQTQYQRMTTAFIWKNGPFSTSHQSGSAGLLFNCS